MSLAESKQSLLDKGKSSVETLGSSIPMFINRRETTTTSNNKGPRFVSGPCSMRMRTMIMMSRSCRWCRVKAFLSRDSHSFEFQAPLTKLKTSQRSNVHHDTSASLIEVLAEKCCNVSRSVARPTRRRLTHSIQRARYTSHSLVSLHQREIVTILACTGTTHEYMKNITMI